MIDRGHRQPGDSPGAAADVQHLLARLKRRYLEEVAGETAGSRETGLSCTRTASVDGSSTFIVFKVDIDRDPTDANRRHVLG